AAGEADLAAALALEVLGEGGPELERAAAEGGERRRARLGLGVGGEDAGGRVGGAPTGLAALDHLDSQPRPSGAPCAGETDDAPAHDGEIGSAVRAHSAWPSLRRYDPDQVLTVGGACGRPLSPASPGSRFRPDRNRSASLRR